MCSSDLNHPAVLGGYSFDFTKCLNDLVDLYPKLDTQDVAMSFFNVVTLSPKSEITILKNVLTGCIENRYFIQDSYFRFYIRNSPSDGYLHRAWYTYDDRYRGYGVFSLVQMFRGGSEVDTFNFVAECLNFKAFVANIPQCSEYGGYSFIRESHAYPVSIFDSGIEGILGSKYNEYNFCNDNGKCSFYLREWRFNKQPLRLFLTLQQNNETRVRIWKYISPPFKFMIYNRHIIDKYKNREVIIHDQIERARIASSFDPKHLISTWSGDLSISSKLNWSFLKGRRVNFIFNKNDKNSMVIGAELIKTFKELGTTLSLYDASEYVPS